MTTTSWSSRDRMLAAMDCEESDHTPCSFMIYGGLKNRCSSYTEFIDHQVELGLDAVVELPPRQPKVVNDYYNLHGIPVSYDTAVQVEEWIERSEDEEVPLMVKEYHTPAGRLRTEVRQTDDWRWGDHVPFLDDYIIPRARKLLVTREEDLTALQYLLSPPKANEIDEYHAQSRPALEQAQRLGLAVAGGWGVGADLISWVAGFENIIYATFDQPDYVHALLEMIARWNRRRMEVVLDAGVDFYIKRAWYENCDFWTPTSWRDFILPVLKADVELAHQAGARFGYIITSNAIPLLDLIAEAGVDVIIGVDPQEWNLELTRQKLGGKVCLWGGVNGHLTVEMGTPDDVELEVEQAMRILAPGGGFILSPVDNVRQDTPVARRNVSVLVDIWKQYCGLA